MFKKKIIGIMVIGLFAFLINHNIGAQSTTPFTDLNTIENYLENARGTLVNPVSLPVRISLGTLTRSDSGWERLLTIIRDSGKPVALDLSACTMDGTVFNPSSDFSFGKANIVSLILPNAAQSIPGPNQIYWSITVYSDTIAFSHFTELREVTGANITNIGFYAFKNCKKLQRVSFPKVTNIGGAAFRYCINLEVVDTPLATSIGAVAFQDNTSLKTINFPVVTVVGISAFWGCINLENINFPRVTNIHREAFSGCNSLINISFPVATVIGYGAFYGCINLKNINFPLVTNIDGNSDAGAFQGCVSLENADFPLVTNIGRETFSGCTNLTSVNFPVVTTIGAYAFGAISHGSSIIQNLRDFSGCIKLSNLNFPRATEIGFGAFSGCTGLERLNIPRVRVIDMDAFKNTGTKSLTITLGGGAPSLGHNLFSGVTKTKTVTVRIPEGVIGYGELPFNNSDTSNNWGNSFRGRGEWAGEVNRNIILIIEEISE